MGSAFDDPKQTDHKEQLFTMEAHGKIETPTAWSQYLERLRKCEATWETFSRCSMEVCIRGLHPIFTERPHRTK